MSKKIVFAILLIPLLGIAAGGVGAWEKTSGGAVEVFVLVFSGVVIGFILLKIPQALKRSRNTSYTKPQITGARVEDGIGELTVAAGHSSDVSRDLRLPSGSRIVTINKGRLYRVELGGADRTAVESVARENGFRGKVGT